MKNKQNSLSLKQIRIIEAVARFSSFATAADHLNMAQSVISRAIKAAEQSLNISIFQRGWGGAEPTAYGEIIVQHCVYMLEIIQNFEKHIRLKNNNAIQILPNLKWHHLESVTAVCRHGGVSNASKSLKLKQPAISRALIATNEYLKTKLFIRNRYGLTPTATAWQLTTLYEDMQKLLENLPQKLNDNGTTFIGRVAVGMLPFSGQDLVAKTFGRLTNQYPSLRLIAVSGDYNMLVQALRHGEIDCIIGMLRQPSPHPDLSETFIYSEHYAFIARTDHICNSTTANASTLKNQKWIGAPYGTPIREYLDNFLKNLGLTPPTQTCEIHSFTNAEQMIIESNSIALLSYSQPKLLELRPELKAIDIDMPNAQNKIGLTHLSSRDITQPVQAFKTIIMQLADDLNL